MEKRLYKTSNGAMISGVLMGLSEYLGMDVSVVRIIYVILSFFVAGFPGIILYIIMALVMPSKESIMYKNNQDNMNNKNL